MGTYIVVGGPLTLPAGQVIRPTRNQAERRTPWLKKLSGGRAELVRPMDFKSGETLELEGEVPKGLLARLTRVAAEEKQVEPARVLPVAAVIRPGV